LELVGDAPFIGASWIGLGYFAAIGLLFAEKGRKASRGCESFPSRRDAGPFRAEHVKIPVTKFAEAPATEQGKFRR
jgi:hypothetical protein